MRRIAGVIGIVAGLGLIAQPAWAARTRAHVAAESPVYKEKLGGMLGRGLLNVVTCPVDIVTNTVNETKAGPPLIGTLVGVAKGVGCGALRLASGAVDVATFWVPGFNGFPVSDSYENCLAGPSAASYAPAPASFTSEPIPASPITSEPAPAPAKRTWQKK
jgi:putative exosortase-associated protein (TIGR04073 family)